ncbi:MAG TPA: hypothetical protein VK808_00225 [Bacteroidia bacterium]|jgi:hypothetical protein|nr:hypothetical protein [Bacteroidia bacterium]
MRKLLFSPILFLALNAFGQSTPPPPTPPPINPVGVAPGPGPMDPPDIISTGQAGTDTLKNGKDTIKLNMRLQMEIQRGQASENYVVLLTPIGDCGELTVAEKKPAYFLVKQKGSGSMKGSYDYAVLIKQKRPQRPLRPQPPMQPGQNNAPAGPVLQQAPAPPVQPQGGQ